MSSIWPSAITARGKASHTQSLRRCTQSKFPIRAARTTDTTSRAIRRMTVQTIRLLRIVSRLHDLPTRCCGVRRIRSTRKDDMQKSRTPATKSKQVVVLSGGNPQIAKADGHAPVKAYIAAMPDAKRAIGKRLDALIVRTVPNVKKAVKWNSPFYGVEGQGWFL